MYNQEQLAAITAALSIIQSMQQNAPNGTQSSNNPAAAAIQQQLAAAWAATGQQQQQQQQQQQLQQPQQIQQQQPAHHQRTQQSHQSRSQINNMTSEQEYTQRLQQELQHLVQSQNQSQPHASRSLAGVASSSGSSGTSSLSIRQQQTLQNSLQQSHLLANDQGKRKRGRPPLSKPGTSSGSSAMDYNYVNIFSAVKSQQERDRMQREHRLQLERQQQMRKQQELDRQRELRVAQERERAREMQMQQDRERARMELDRQRKAQHRLAMADIDRERRRYHMIMVRNLDAYKRNEEREKAVSAMMEERNKQNERRMHQKRLEVELVKELRKPVDDMMLKNQKPLATLNRIPGLKLPGKAFADLLMSYEFLFNFGETVGLELRQISDINTLQLGLLNLCLKSEDQLIAIMHHLCMFAIKDSRFPYTGSLKEIENLDRTNEGLSQLLHFYLQVLTLNAKTDMEHENRLYRLIEQKYFLALNATQKAEMLAFICNELLCSQTVTKQMEDTIENVAKLRKDKWVQENELRKFRSIRTKRELREEAEQRAKEAAEAAAAVAEAAAEAAASANGEVNTIKNENSTDSNEVKPNIKKEEIDKKLPLTNGSTVGGGGSSPAKKEKDTDTSAQQNTTNDLDDLEPEMTNDELYKKIENLTRQYNKISNKLERAINSMRANPLGQDRYRRRYWVLPQVGGVFVEGMESSEPEELVNNKFTDEDLDEYEKEQQALNELANTDESTENEPENDTEKADGLDDDKDDDDMDVKEDVDEKDDDELAETNDEDIVDQSDVKVEAANKNEAVENIESEGDKNTSEVCAEDQAQENGTGIPWFSILPRQLCDFNAPVENEPMEEDESQKKTGDEESVEIKAELTIEELKAKRHEICPGLAKRLEELEAEQYEAPRKIHPQFQFGWWRITDSQQLKSILAVLHDRGTRERTLHKHLTKHFQYACNSCRNNTVDFEITSYDRQLAGKNYGAPVPHTDEDSADELMEDEEEEDGDGDEYEEETGDDKVIQQTAAAPAKKSKRKKGSRSARSRRLRARAAARKKVENSKNKLTQKI